MELQFTNAQIARLVLGYLKAESCKPAYKSFLISSKHLKKTLKNKYFVTRFNDLTLEDILHEYHEIYTIVNARLEPTNYYTDENSKHSLVDKVVYLLNKVKYDTTVRRDSSSTSMEPGSDVDTTPASTLPGNIECVSEGSYFHKPPRLNMFHNQSAGCAPDQTPGTPDAFTDTLTQSMLDNKALLEKIAESINVVRQQPEMGVALSASDESIRAGASAELEATIKTVVERTEQDPVFTQIIEEFIGVQESPENPDPPPIAISSTTSDKSNSIDVTFFDGTLDTYMKATAQPILYKSPSPVFVNTGPGILLLKPAMQPLPIITSQDIMSMPTVIVKDSPVMKKPAPKPVAKPAAKPVGKKRVNKAAESKPTANAKSKTISRIAPKGAHAAKFFEQFNANLEKMPTDPHKLHSTPKTSEAVQKFSPRSGSHVRNLDFSTPPKMSSTNKKKDKTDSPRFVHKKQAAKTLFKSKTTDKKVSKAWDSDLRVLASTDTNETVPTMKRKRRSPASTKRKLRKTEKEEMNSTELDGQLLEAALCSPVYEANNENMEPKVNKVDEAKVEEKAPPVTKVGSATKTILSPSRLIANKKKVGRGVSAGEADADKGQKLVTPEMAALKGANVLPVKACRNITPLLETPLKDFVPKTPGLDTPQFAESFNISSITPFNKVIDEQLQGIDINSIHTPNIPITPGFPSTMDLTSPFPNRPTDYSTSSSYYQPSDSEQNRSVELKMLIAECKRLDAPPPPPTDQKFNIISNVLIDTKATTEPAKTDNVLNEHLKVFQSNMIGKKNLNLVHRVSTSSESSSSSSASSSAESSDSESDSKDKWNDDDNDNTVICKEKKKVEVTPRPYAIRTRGMDKSEEKAKTAEIRSIISGAEVKENLKTKRTKGSNSQEKLLKEMEEKRKRMITKIKHENVPKRVLRTRLPKKPYSPKKTPPQKSARVRKLLPRSTKRPRTYQQSIASSEEDQISLRISSDDGLKRVEVPKSASDLEAENLITNLRERGIHLVHNKSPKKVHELPKTPEPVLETIDEDAALFEQQVVVESIDETAEVRMVFDEKSPIAKKLEDYNLDILNRTVVAQIYIDRVEDDVELLMTCSPIQFNLDIASKCNNLIPKRRHNRPKLIADPRATHLAATSVKKADNRIGEETGTSATEVKSSNKKQAEILKTLDVDNFLDSLHGG